MATNPYITKTTRRAVRSLWALARLWRSWLYMRWLRWRVRHAAPVIVDPHPAWIEEMAADTAEESAAYHVMIEKYGHDDFDRLDGDDVRQYKQLAAEKTKRFHTLMNQCASTPARSPEGCLAKAVLLWKALHVGETGHETALAMGLMRDLQAMCDGPPSPRAANAYREERRLWSTKTDMAEMEGGAS